MNPIKILGGGIAGLTAAINQKKAGRDVEVHERKTFCGKPLMYLVTRWPIENSINSELSQQASREGVRIIYQSPLDYDQVDIIATGFNKTTFIDRGIMFTFHHPDRSIVLLDDTCFYKLYSYFIVNDNIAEIVCLNPVGLKDHKVRLDLTISRFEEILNIKIDNIRERFTAPFFRILRVFTHSGLMIEKNCGL